MTCVQQMHVVCVYVCTYACECVRVCTVQHSCAMVCLVSLLSPWVSGLELTLSGLCTKHFSEVGHFTSLFTSTLFRGVGWGAYGAERVLVLTLQGLSEEPRTEGLWRVVFSCSNPLNAGRVRAGEDGGATAYGRS